MTGERIEKTSFVVQIGDDLVVLSPRLQAVLDFIKADTQKKILTDIGTDHAYLPIAAVKQGICGSAIACDLHPGPLSIAADNIRSAGLEDKIKTRLGNGFMPLSPGEADCVVIAGMGGMRIWGIILEGMAKARAASRLILQPQHDDVLLRKKLHENGFEIQGEKLSRETVGNKEHFYVVLAARYIGEVGRWTEREYFLGKFLIEDGGKDFSAYIQSKHKKIAAYISQISDKSVLSAAKQHLEWLKQ